MAGTATVNAGDNTKVKRRRAASRSQRTPPATPERPPRLVKAVPRRKAAEHAGPPAPLANEPGPVDASPAPCPPVNQTLQELVGRASGGARGKAGGRRKAADRP